MSKPIWLYYIDNIKSLQTKFSAQNSNFNFYLWYMKYFIGQLMVIFDLDSIKNLQTKFQLKISIITNFGNLQFIWNISLYEIFQLTNPLGFLDLCPIIYLKNQTSALNVKIYF